MKSKALFTAFLSLTLILVQTSNVFASPPSIFPEQDVKEILISGFEVSDAIDAMGTLLGDEMQLLPSDINFQDYDAEWIEDARQFVDDHQITPQSASAVVSDMNLAKSTSLSYAMECADWSVKKGRAPASDIDNESMYMFISHYIDRTEYFWSKGDLSYLMDGESISEGGQYYAKWLVRDDRNVYRTYINQSRVSKSLNKAKAIASGIYEIYSSKQDMEKVLNDFNRTEKMIDQARASYIAYTDTSDTFDILNDIESIKNYVYTNSKELKLSIMYDNLMRDENLFRNIDSQLKNRLLFDTVSMFGSIFVVGLAGGATQLGFNIISFTIDVYLDLFDTAAYAAMRNSFHARQANRMYDYIMSEYM